MAYNFGIEIPEPTGNIEYDYQELYTWAMNVTDSLKRNFRQMSNDNASIEERLGSIIVTNNETEV